MATTAVKSAQSDVASLLSTSLVVSSEAFAKLKPAKQTEVLTSAGGKPIVFVDSFSGLRSPKRIIDGLLAGNDVSMELEFNGIEITAEETAALAAIKPVLEKIKALIPPYPFAEVPENATFLTISGSRVGNGNYYISKEQAEGYWKRAARFWAGVVKKAPGELYQQVGGNGYNYIRVYKDSIALGCQTIERYKIEALAKELGWEFPTAPSA